MKLKQLIRSLQKIEKKYGGECPVHFTAAVRCCDDAEPVCLVAAATINPPTVDDVQQWTDGHCKHPCVYLDYDATVSRGAIAQIGKDCLQHLADTDLPE